MINTDIVFSTPCDINEYVRICTQRDFTTEKIRKNQTQWFNEHMIINRNDDTDEVSIECDEMDLEGLTVNEVSIFVAINCKSENLDKMFENDLSVDCNEMNHEVQNDALNNCHCKNKNCDVAECEYYSHDNNDSICAA